MCSSWFSRDSRKEEVGTDAQGLVAEGTGKF